MLLLLVFLMLLAGSVAALSCWHCIADNCEQNPEDNYKAAKRQCLEGQFCQVSDSVRTRNMSMVLKVKQL